MRETASVKIISRLVTGCGVSAWENISPTAKYIADRYCCRRLDSSSSRLGSQLFSPKPCHRIRS